VSANRIEMHSSDADLCIPPTFQHYATPRVVGVVVGSGCGVT